MEIENDKLLRVFIADNNDKTKEEIGKLFAENKKAKIVGFADDGNSVLKFLKDNQVDILIMDAVLGGIDGFTLLEEIKRNRLNVKTIVVSSLSHDGFISKALELGASYYLSKPIDVELLWKRIEDTQSESQYPIGIQRKNFNRALEEKISNIFITVGIPAHIKGYQFLREAIKLAIDTPEIINSITKKLYPSIAERFDTSSSKVERAIRHAIEVAWTRGRVETIDLIFGYTIDQNKGKPTNSEFIAMVADKIRVQIGEFA